MAGEFITENFLLSSDSAVELYQRFAKDQPIIDYHCHLSPKEIAENRQFSTLTQIWLAGDHYKWRAMRANGVDERAITGEASDWEKFLAWARTVPSTLMNPLYHWTHMELKRPFGITGVLLNESTAREVWERGNALLAQPAFRARAILEQMNVEVVCTTDDPVDDLRYHRLIRDDAEFGVKVRPAFRADMALAIDRGQVFRSYVERLGVAADVHIVRYRDFLDAIRKRHAYFHQEGCRLSDHGLETVFVDPHTEEEVSAAFARAMGGKEVEPSDVLKFKSAVLFELCLLDHAAGWVQQFHLGALRNTNPRMFRVLGPDTGYDSIGDFDIGRPLARLFGALEDRDALAKTVVYNLNPSDNEVVATLIGSFQDGRTPGKMQYGSPWWFLDQRDGMQRQLTALSTMGLLSRFVGMLTDSRSFLSFPRHEYFRRILCDMLGREIDQGLLPPDFELIGEMVADICYGNARRYFGFWKE